jgi:hypothetical protein
MKTLNTIIKKSENNKKGGNLDNFSILRLSYDINETENKYFANIIYKTTCLQAQKILSNSEYAYSRQKLQIMTELINFAVASAMSQDDKFKDFVKTVEFEFASIGLNSDTTLPGNFDDEASSVDASDASLNIRNLLVKKDK